MACSLCGKFGEAAAYCNYQGCPRDGHYTSYVPPKTSNPKPRSDINTSNSPLNSPHSEIDAEKLEEGLIAWAAIGVGMIIFIGATIKYYYMGTKWILDNTLDNTDNNEVYAGLITAASLTAFTAGFAGPPIYEGYITDKYPAISASYYSYANGFFGEVYFSKDKGRDTAIKKAQSDCSSMHNCTSLGTTIPGTPSCLVVGSYIYRENEGMFKTVILSKSKDDSLDGLIFYDPWNNIYFEPKIKHECNSEEMDKYFDTLYSDLKKEIENKNNIERYSPEIALGMGIEFQDFKDKENWEIYRLYNAGPAWRAQLASGDLVTRIDDLVLKAHASKEILEYLKAKTLPEVKLTIFRPKTKATYEIVLVREPIPKSADYFAQRAVRDPVSNDRKKNQTDIGATQSLPKVIKPTYEYFRVTATSGLNIRYGASTSYAAKATLEQNSCVAIEYSATAVQGFIEIIARTDDGANIEGYVKADYLSPIISTPAACVATLK